MSRRRTRCVPSVHLFSRHRVLRVVFAHRAPLSLARPRLHRSARRRLMVTMTMRVPQNAATFCPSGKRHRAFARATPQNDRGIHHASPVRPRAVVCTRPRISNLVDERQSRRSRRASHHRETDDDLMVVDETIVVPFSNIPIDDVVLSLEGFIRWSRSGEGERCVVLEKKAEKESPLPSSPSSSLLFFFVRRESLATRWWWWRRPDDDDFLWTVTTKTVDVFKGKPKNKKIGLGSYC